MRDGAVVAGGKATMLDTGSWVPLIVSWPAKIRSGSIYDGLIQFPDLMPTFLDLAGARVPAGLDGISFAAQLQGNPGAPREWVHVLHATEVEKKAEKKTGKPNVKIFYFVRDARWKLRENGELYDVSHSPDAEKLVKLEDDTSESKTARERLGAVLHKLHD
jgi:arylsulfatase A-like enzyme